MTVRSIVLVLLVLVGTSDVAAGKDVRSLVDDLGHADATVRRKARDELVARKDPACVGRILAALPGFALVSRTAAQQVLEGLPPAASGRAFRSLLRSKDPELRALAAASLTRQGSAGFLSTGIEALGAKGLTEAQRWAVIVRLYTLRHPDVTEALRELLPELSGHSYRYALIHLDIVEDWPAIPVLSTLTGSKDPSVRLPARALLYRLGQTEVAGKLAKDLAAPQGPPLALRDALRFLGRTSTPPTTLVDALCTRLEADSRTEVRVDVLGQLTRWRCGAVLARIEPFVENADPKVSRAALGFVLRLAGRAQRAPLLRALESRDPKVRVLAAEALGRLDDHSGLAAVFAGLRAKNVIVRREAARVAGTFTLRRMVAPLIETLADRDRLVRIHAWDGLRRIVDALFPYRHLDWAGLAYSQGGPATRRAEVVTILRAWWRARS